MLAIAVCAVAITVATRLWPWIMWRYQVAASLDAVLTDQTLSGGSNLNSVAGAAKTPRRLLAGEYPEYADRLLDALQGNDLLRRVNAADALRQVVTDSTDPALRQRCLNVALEQAFAAGAPAMLDAKLAQVAATCLNRGARLTSDQRTRLVAHLKSASPDRWYDWAFVLNESGGRDEMLLLLDRAREDPTLWGRLRWSRLYTTRWPGAWPYMAAALDDPAAAESVMGYSLVWGTRRGRAALLAYLLNPARPVGARQTAFQQLLETRAGVDLVLRVLGTDLANAAVSATLRLGDLRQRALSTRKEIEDWFDHEFWSEVIAELDPKTIAPAAWRERSKANARFILRELSGRSDIEAAKDWRAWLDAGEAPAVSHRALVRLSVAHAELLEEASLAVRRRVVPYRLGEIPDDCVADYIAVAQSSSHGARLAAWSALLAYTDRTQEVPAMIDRMIREPGDRPWIVLLLRERFAQDFGDDMEAWQRWWQAGGESGSN